MSKRILLMLALLSGCSEAPPTVTEPETPIEVGDYVLARGSDIIMTVEKIHDGKVDCFYETAHNGWQGEGVIKREQFPLTVLRKWKRKK